MQLGSLVTICAETQETNGELFPNTVQLKKWYVTSTLEAAVGPFPVVYTFLPCSGNCYSESFPNSAFIYSFTSYVSLK